MSIQQEITQLLLSWDTDDQNAIDQIFPIVYDELRRMAHNRLLNERPGHTLSTTDLVNETYLKLVDQTQIDWNSRTHFFAIASTAMRRILVDYARNYNAKKRGGKKKPITFNENEIEVKAQAADLIDLNDALDRLAVYKERLPKVVECRFFGGLTEKETARALNISPSTVRRDWAEARAWLHKELQAEY